MKILELFTKKMLIPLAVIAGVFCGFYPIQAIISLADLSSDIFMKLLKLISLPIIFLSIVSTVSGMESIDEFKSLGKKVAKYTVVTTLIAASIALGLFLLIDPVNSEAFTHTLSEPQMVQTGYLSYLFDTIPSNFLEPFIKNNVVSVLFLALLFSLSIVSLPQDKQQTLHHFFKSLYAAVMKITAWILRLMPLAIWAFITLFVQEMYQDGETKTELQSIMLYLTVVVLANLLQATIVLPLFLKSKGLSPLKMAQAMYPALSVAFFSKSSSAALPMAVKCAEERANVSRKVAGFSLPLCTTINMNACAAFILTTVLFVSMSYGMTFTPVELLVWIVVATIAAIGNAGVPMGCYMLSQAILVSMDVPLVLLGAIFPMYSLIDMLESAINVWSDSCVTVMVQQDLCAEELRGTQTATPLAVEA